MPLQKFKNYKTKNKNKIKKLCSGWYAQYMAGTLEISRFGRYGRYLNQYEHWRFDTGIRTSTVHIAQYSTVSTTLPPIHQTHPTSYFFEYIN